MDFIRTVIIETDKNIRDLVLPFYISKISELKISGVYEHGFTFLTSLALDQPQLVFIDLDLPLLNGIETTKRLISIIPDIKIICLSTAENEGMLLEMYNAGARGFLHKLVSFAEIRQCVKTVLSGNMFVSTQINNDDLHKKATLNRANYNPA